MIKLNNFLVRIPGYVGPGKLISATTRNISVKLAFTVDYSS